MSFTEKRLLGPTTLTTSASSALYTVPAGKSTIIKQIVATNTSASAATFTLYIGAATAANAIFSGTSVSANDSLVINLSQVLASTEEVRALASANSAINLTISGVENDGPLNPLSTYIADGAISTAKLADSSVTTAKIAAGAVIEEDIANGAVTSAKILDGTIVNADINAAAAIDATKISGTAVVSSTIDAKGDLLAGTADNTISRLAVGSNNRYLRANSGATTGLEWSTNQVGLELVASTTFSNSNNLLMNGVFTSTYDNYVVFFNLTSVSSATTVFMRLANGSSVDASGVYLYGGFISYMGSSILTAINNGGASTDWPLVIQDGTYGYANTPMRIEVVQPRLSYRTAIFSSGFQPVNPLPYYRHLGGVTSNTTSYDGFTIIGNNSSFTLSGTISVYGYRIS